MNKTNISRSSVIIRTYNEEKHIGRLLSGIMNQNIKDIDIIIIDSGSTDSTLSIASKYPVKILKIQPEEFSFGRSLNLACESTITEFIVFASAHVYPVYDDWLEKLLNPFENKQIALTYGKQRGDNNTKYSEHQIFHKWFPEEREIVDKHPFCNNANAAIRKSVWKKIPYDESLTGLEDLDWAKRAIDLDYTIKYVPEAEIIHVHEESYSQIYNRYRREAMAFNNIYSDEKFGLTDFIKLCLINIVSDYYHSIQDSKFIENIFSIPVFRVMQFFGTYKGYREGGKINDSLRNIFYYPRGMRPKNKDTLKETRHKIDYSDIEH